MTATIPGLRFGEFQGLPALLVSTPFSRAAISLFGGHVLSWTPQGFDDVLWLSPITKRPPDPIRGGIPVCGIAMPARKADLPRVVVEMGSALGEQYRESRWPEHQRHEHRGRLFRRACQPAFFRHDQIVATEKIAQRLNG